MHINPDDWCPGCLRERRDPRTIVTGSDNRVLPLRGLPLELATHIGAVTMAFGALDAAMQGLHTTLAPPLDLDTIKSTWGQTGAEFTKALRALIPDVGREFQQRLADICDRYDALYEVRNDLIHAYRPGRDDEILTAVRARRSTKRAPITTVEDLCVRRPLGVSELIDLWYDVDDLTRDARDLFIQAAFPSQDR